MYKILQGKRTFSTIIRGTFAYHDKVALERFLGGGGGARGGAACSRSEPKPSTWVDRHIANCDSKEKSRNKQSEVTMKVNFKRENMF